MRPKVYRIEIDHETTVTLRAALEIYSKALTVEIRNEEARMRSGATTARVLELLEMKQRAANARRMFAEMVEPTPNADRVIEESKRTKE